MTWLLKVCLAVSGWPACQNESHYRFPDEDSCYKTLNSIAKQPAVELAICYPVKKEIK